MLSEVGTVNVVQVGSKSHEIENPLTWAFYFLAPLAVSVKNQKAKDMAVYAQPIIHLSQKHWGRGWLAYDRLFRQQATVVPTTYETSWPPPSWLLPLWSWALYQKVMWTMQWHRSHHFAMHSLNFLDIKKKEKEKEEKDMLTSWLWKNVSAPYSVVASLQPIIKFCLHF